MNLSTLIKSLPWIGVVAAGGWLVHQLAESRSLQHALRSARMVDMTTKKPAPAATPASVSPKSGAIQPTAGSFDPTTLVNQVRERVAPLLRSGLGHAHPDLQSIVESALAPLDSAALSAVIAGDPEFRFATRYNQAAMTGDERIDAILRWRALQNLAAEDPAAALRLTENAEIKETSGEMINLITSSLQRWTESDATAAVRWGKAHADRLPLGINHAHMALEALARTDMAGAWALARREGIDTTQAMAYLSRAVATRADCDTFMTEVTALQAAAPHGFVGGTNQYHETLAAKLALTLGIDEARSFLDRWSSTLEWRDTAALAAVKTTFSRTADPRSASAADWFVAFTPDNRRAAAVPTLISAWADEDFSQPAEWLKHHSNAPWHDAALAALCRKIAPFDPAAATEWAAGIQDAALRDSIFDR